MTDINKYKKRFNQLACIEDTYLINFMICSQNFIADLHIIYLSKHVTFTNFSPTFYMLSR